MSSIRAVLRPDLDVADLCALSRAGLDRSLLHPAELLVAVPKDSALVLGAYQRPSELGPLLSAFSAWDRRGTGGAEAIVGTGTVWLQLTLAQCSALVPCPPQRLINRYVRPLLRAVTELGVLAHYFERDWVSGAKRPIASVAFAHDTATGRAYFEAIASVTTPLSIRSRAATMGKEPATLAELGMLADATALAQAIVASYEDAYGASAGELAIANPPRGFNAPVEASWAATCAEAIGIVAAGRDRDGILRVGGELMVSRDALSRLESALGELPAAAGLDAIGACVDAALGAPGVALFGVRSLRSIRDVIARAR